ncbi:outer membrane protein assembly factor BamB [Rhodococcus sp. 27YEA15]|uniref:outer membrane protein assembly factor BamB family protein n=1 Tax=Rhodococcus sp. 27YEA15 TaxID=3156259 RepID=UPI003C7C7954
MRRVLWSSVTAMTAVAAMVLTGCSSSDIVDRYATPGWAAAHSDAHNSGSTSVAGSRDLDFAFSRPLGGPVAGSASVGSSGQSFVTARTENGCNLFSFQLDSGRKKWCARLNDGVVASTPLVDRATNTYVGESGAILSFADTGQLRWRTLTVGTPLSAQFTGDGNLLFVTQLGQVNVLNPQTGAKVVPSFDLVPPPSADTHSDADLIPDDLGLNDCFLGGSGCVVAGIPAVDLESGRFYFTFTPPGAQTGQVVAMKYTGGDSPSITREWSSQAAAGGAVASPSLSQDGTTLYATDAKGTLWALDADSGASKWSYDLGFDSAGNTSVSDDGLIIPGGGSNGHLLAIRDKGDDAELVWERKDLVLLGVPAQSAGNTGYVVVGDGTTAVSLLTFDTTSGETLDQDTLPGAVGATVGTSVGPTGEVLVPSALGELFVFK